MSKGSEEDIDDDITDNVCDRSNMKIYSNDNDQLMENENREKLILSNNLKTPTKTKTKTKITKQNKRIFACTCVLDPSCTALLVSFSDGELHVWPLIGVNIGASAVDKMVCNK